MVWVAVMPPARGGRIPEQSGAGSRQADGMGRHANLVVQVRVLYFGAMLQGKRICHARTLSYSRGRDVVSLHCVKGAQLPVPVTPRAQRRSAGIPDDDARGAGSVAGVRGEHTSGQG